MSIYVHTSIGILSGVNTFKFSIFNSIIYASYSVSTIIRRDYKWAYITHYTYHIESHLHHKNRTICY